MIESSTHLLHDLMQWQGIGGIFGLGRGSLRQPGPNAPKFIHPGEPGWKGDQAKGFWGSLGRLFGGGGQEFTAPIPGAPGGTAAPSAAPFGGTRWNGSYGMQMPRRGGGGGASLPNDVFGAITQAEGTSRNGQINYDDMLGHVGGPLGTPPKPISSMSLNEVDAWQSQMLANPANRWHSSAAGAAQIVRTTLRAQREKLGLTGNETFDAAMQKRLAGSIWEEQGSHAWQGFDARPDLRQRAENLRRSGTLAAPATGGGIGPTGIGRTKTNSIGQQYRWDGDTWVPAGGGKQSALSPRSGIRLAAFDGSVESGNLETSPLDKYRLKIPGTNIPDRGKPEDWKSPLPWTMGSVAPGTADIGSPTRRIGGRFGGMGPHRPTMELPGSLDRKSDLEIWGPHGPSPARPPHHQGFGWDSVSSDLDFLKGNSSSDSKHSVEVNFNNAPRHAYSHSKRRGAGQDDAQDAVCFRGDLGSADGLVHHVAGLLPDSSNARLRADRVRRSAFRCQRERDGLMSRSPSCNLRERPRASSYLPSRRSGS